MTEKGNKERTIYQRAIDAAAQGETVIDVVCAAVDEVLKAVEARCEERIAVLKKLVTARRYRDTWMLNVQCPCVRAELTALKEQQHGH